MNLKEVMSELESYGDKAIKNIFLKHEISEPLFGVRVQDMKKIVKKIKKDHQLSMDLFTTGNYDAQYLAGLIADEKQISENDLQLGVEAATNYSASQYPVAWVAAESNHGYKLGLEWIESDDELIATAGWCTLAALTSITPDAELDTDKFSSLLDRIENDIHTSQNRVRYNMNGFVIAVGYYIKSLTEKAQQVASNIGKVHVTMGETACKVPLAKDYIQKGIDKGKIGKKRKMARC